MKAVILAAGIASRLRPFTNSKPKCMIQLGGKSILERTISSIRNYSIDEFIIVTGYLEEQITKFLNKFYPSSNISFIHNELYASTNNIYSLWLTKNRIKNTDILLLDSDIIFDQRIIGILLDSGPGNFLAIRSDHDMGEEEMKVITSENNVITKISKNIDPALAAGESIGIEKFEAEFIDVLFEKINYRVVNEGRHNDFYEEAFQDAIDDGQKLYALNVGEYPCIEIDTIDDIKSAEKIVLHLLDEIT